MDPKGSSRRGFFVTRNEVRVPTIHRMKSGKIKWRARVSHPRVNKSIDIGTFWTFAEASRAEDEFRVKHNLPPYDTRRIRRSEDAIEKIIEEWKEVRDEMDWEMGD